MIKSFGLKIRKVALLCIIANSLLLGSYTPAIAGGIALGATRVIYPIGKSQVSLAVTNSDKKNIYLIQSWVSGADGLKSSDFVVTPPLFSIQSGKENTLRIMYVGKNLPADRESIYYINSKAIPGGAAPVPGQNTLQIATQSIIKMFMRPSNLPSRSIDAPNSLTCKYSGDALIINNPSPYYVSLVNLKVGSFAQPNTLVPPKGNTRLTLQGINKGDVSFQSVNDYGASSNRRKCIIQ